MKLRIEVQVTGWLTVEVDEKEGQTLLDDVEEAGTPMSPDDMPKSIQDEFEHQLQQDLLALEVEVMQVKEPEARSRPQDRERERE